MYSTFLFLHSITRWVLLIGIVYILIRGYKGWLSKSSFSSLDNRVKIITVSAAHIQLIFGIVLYAVSPFIKHLFQNFSEAVHIKDYRFFAMDHTVSMLIAVILITIGSAKSKRKSSDKMKHKTLAIWFTIALVLIFMALPWSFLPMTPERPLFRGF